MHGTLLNALRRPAPHSLLLLLLFFATCVTNELPRPPPDFGSLDDISHPTLLWERLHITASAHPPMIPRFGWIGPDRSLFSLPVLTAIMPHKQITFSEEAEMHSKQNLNAESEAEINKLVNIKLTASYTYLALGMYFDRDDVALPSFSSFFLERSVKDREQAEKLLEYQTMRGGRVLLQTIAKPSREDWKGGLDAMSFSLEYQKALNAAVLDVHRRAESHADPHLCKFLEEHFLSDSYDTIKKLGDYTGSLTRLTTSETHGAMGEYLFDELTL